MGERVSIQISDHVATVTLTRPEKHNALDGPMFRAVVDAAIELDDAANVRVVVLHGEGPSFCSGLDISSLGTEDAISLDDLEARHEGNRANLPQRACTGWIDLPVPVIAAVHGNCFGGGLQIALGADIRIVAPDARLSVREVQWGLVPDMGITLTLPRLVSVDIAKELTFTGRIFSGEEAAAIGVATRVADDPLAIALELATEIAGRSPDAVRAAKRLYDTAHGMAPEEALMLESRLQGSLIGSPNQIAAVVAGAKKEQPVFEDPVTAAPVA